MPNSVEILSWFSMDDIDITDDQIQYNLLLLTPCILYDTISIISCSMYHPSDCRIHRFYRPFITRSNTEHHRIVSDTVSSWNRNSSMDSSALYNSDHNKYDSRLLLTYLVNKKIWWYQTRYDLIYSMIICRYGYTTSSRYNYFALYMSFFRRILYQ